jgi:hypothetical protein
MMLDRAIDLVPKSRLHLLNADCIRPEEIEPNGRKLVDLLTEVAAFVEACRQGVYYEDFNVNSRNYMETSAGNDDRFIVDCDRLLKRCVKNSEQSRDAETAEAFELIFSILRRIDDGYDDVFFADEAGSWQVGVDWRSVFPAWFKALAATASPAEFASKVVCEVDHYASYDRAHYLAAARRVATAEQKAALKAKSIARKSQSN